MLNRPVRYLLFVALMTALLFTLLYNAEQLADSAELSSIPAKRQLVRNLGLTDLSLWSEARYTRHPSQADIFTPFQDYPAAADHFPAGSILAAQAPKPVTSIRVIKKARP